MLTPGAYDTSDLSAAMLSKVVDEIQAQGLGDGDGLGPKAGFAVANQSAWNVTYPPGTKPRPSRSFTVSWRFEPPDRVWGSCQVSHVGTRIDLAVHQA